MVSVIVTKEENVSEHAIVAIATAFVEWMEEQGWMIEPGEALKRRVGGARLDNTSWEDEAVRWVSERESEDPDPHARWSIRSKAS